MDTLELYSQDLEVIRASPGDGLFLELFLPGENDPFATKILNTPSITDRTLRDLGLMISEPFAFRFSGQFIPEKVRYSTPWVHSRATKRNMNVHANIHTHINTYIYKHVHPYMNIHMYNICMSTYNQWVWVPYVMISTCFGVLKLASYRKDIYILISIIWRVIYVLVLTAREYSKCGTLQRNQEYFRPKELISAKYGRWIWYFYPTDWLEQQLFLSPWLMTENKRKRRR